MNKNNIIKQELASITKTTNDLTAIYSVIKKSYTPIEQALKKVTKPSIIFGAITVLLTGTLIYKATKNNRVKGE